MKKLKIVCLSLALVASALMAKNFNVDNDHSNIGFSIKHNSISYIKGKFKAYDASVDYDINNKIFNALKADIQISSIDTEVLRRDAHLKSADFFNSDKFPKMTFIMTKYIKKTDNTGEIIGNLTLKNITKEIKLNSKIHGLIIDKNKKQRVGFTLDGKINRKDFTVGENFINSIIADEVQLEIDVEAIEK